MGTGYPHPPFGNWRVRTEGDFEGRSPPKELGTFTGHVVDIAAFLAPQCAWALEFEPAPARGALVDIATAPVDVCVTLPAESRTWPGDMENAARPTFFRAWLGRSAPYARFQVNVGRAYGSVELEIRP